MQSQTACQAPVTALRICMIMNLTYLALAPPLARAKQRRSLGALLRCHMLWL